MDAAREQEFGDFDAGRRAVLKRARTRALSVAAVCMATVAVMALPWLLGAGGLRWLGFGTADPSEGANPSEPAVGPSGSGQPSAPANVDPTPAVGPPDLPGMSPSAATAELSRVLAEEAKRILPDAQFGPTVVGFDDGQRLLQPFDVVDNGHGYYVGWAAISNGPLQGDFTIAIWPRADNRKSPNPGCDSAYFPRLGCEGRTGPNGEQITIEMGQWQNSTTVEYRVKVHRPQGMILMATVTSESGGAYGFQTQAPDNPTPPMTVDQLVEVLLTPGLVLR